MAQETPISCPFVNTKVRPRIPSRVLQRPASGGQAAVAEHGHSTRRRNRERQGWRRDGGLGNKILYYIYIYLFCIYNIYIVRYGMILGVWEMIVHGWFTIIFFMHSIQMDDDWGNPILGNLHVVIWDTCSRAWQHIFGDTAMILSMLKATCSRTRLQTSMVSGMISLKGRPCENWGHGTARLCLTHLQCRGSKFCSELP